MYAAAPFRPTSAEQVIAIIERHPFALLISRDDQDRLVASHTPMMIDGRDPGHGSLTLFGHVARANPQWRSLDSQEVLCVFSGAHTHISPTWYATAPAVPTWDYTAAHLRGVPTLITEIDEVEVALARMSATFEGEGWRLADQPATYRQSMLRGLVGFRIRVTSIEASFKLSQNRSDADKAGVVSALRNREREGDLEIADLIERHTGRATARDIPGSA